MSKLPLLLQLDPVLSPQGHVYFEENTEIQPSPKSYGNLAPEEEIWQAFAENYAKGLLYLGIKKNSTDLPETLAFWHGFVHEILTSIRNLPEKINPKSTSIPKLSNEFLHEYISKAPFFKGSEYLNPDLLEKIWQDIIEAFFAEVELHNNNIQQMLQAHNSTWHLAGRICFHLAENKNNPDLPFAFIATFSPKAIKNQPLKHLPLKNALLEYAGEKNKEALITLLAPIYDAAKISLFLQSLIDSGHIFQPLAWTAQQAHSFLSDIPIFEQAGIVVRMPNWWNPKKPIRPQINITVNASKKANCGIQELLNFDINKTLPDGQILTDDEWAEIANTKESLIKVKGQWIEVNHEQLQNVLDHWKKIQKQVDTEGLSFIRAMQLISGDPFHLANKKRADEIAAWSCIHAEETLKARTHAMHNPTLITNDTIISVLKKHLHATLRSYQMHGVQWLYLLYSLRIGGCLADDMGLGKTIQIISLLLTIKHNTQKKKPAHLLIAPASLITNWQREIQRFAPSLKITCLHPSAMPNFKDLTDAELSQSDLVITTYGLSYNLPVIKNMHWDIIILDEAQAIKNPGSKQTLAVKQLNSRVRFVLTGTPIENSLIDLWSLFDFFAPGLLGTSKIFGQYLKQAHQSNASKSHAKIRNLISPYILRRLKTDKHIAPDLPDKTEVTTYCSLSPKQIALYQQAVYEFEYALNASADNNIQRQGIILSYIIRLKQICNHPAHWLGYGDYAPAESGKFQQLKEICELIAQKQEKVLIFTQFKEVIEPLAEFLSSIFKRQGLILHGETSVKNRGALVEAFAQEQGPPFFILSLKAGGTGLTLTQAAHVIHFDRWWNPAVENQATDRAYRIGQKKNVMVHKFVSQGTIEEKIDILINEKKSLSDQLLGTQSELQLTKLSNQELLKIVSLDINKIIE